MTSGGSAAISRARAALFVVFLATGLCEAAILVPRIEAGLLPDERAHVSYVRDAAARSAFVPRFEAMRLLSADGSFGPEPNYLPHPPFAYRLLAALEAPLGDLAAPGLRGAIRSSRRAALLPLAAALAAALWVGIRGTGPAAPAALFGTILVSVPMVPLSGANPDVTALLGGALAGWGALRTAEGSRSAATGLLLGGGVALAALSKLTAALLAGALLAAVVSRALLELRRSRAPLPRAWLAGVLLPLALPAAWWLAVTLRYRTPIPSLSTTDPAAFAKSGWSAESRNAVRLAFPAWSLRAARMLDFSFRGVAAHVTVPASGPLSWPLRLVPLLALLGLLVPARGPDDAAALFVLRAAAAATGLLLCANLAASWREHLLYGNVGGLQARYYFPLLPLLLLADLRALARLLSPRAAGAAAWGGAALVAAGHAALLARGHALGVF